VEQAVGVVPKVAFPIQATATAEGRGPERQLLTLEQLKDRHDPADDGDERDDSDQTGVHFR